MVSFTCSDCNQVLKKNKVDAHFVGRCRNAAYVSCVDCSVDFYGKMKNILRIVRIVYWLWIISASNIKLVFEATSETLVLL